MAKYVCVDQSLALITYHVALYINIVILWLYHHSNKLGHPRANRVLERVHFLALSRFLNFFCCKYCVLINLGKDLSHTFEAQCRGNHVYFMETRVV